MELIQPVTLVFPKPQDTFPMNFENFYKKFGEGWTGLSIHPRSETNQIYLDAIDTLDKILSIAERHNIPMVTEHKTGSRDRYFVTSNRREK